MQAYEGNICEGFIVVCVVLFIFAFIVSCTPVLSVLSFIASCITVFLSSVCMLYVYGCFGEINYNDDNYNAGYISSV